jgi:hypothetical protein
VVFKKTFPSDPSPFPQVTPVFKQIKQGHIHPSHHIRKQSLLIDPIYSAPSVPTDHGDNYSTNHNTRIFQTTERCFNVYSRVPSDHMSIKLVYDKASEGGKNNDKNVGLFISAH